MSEKRSETYLDLLLNDFPKANIFYSPNENAFLKEIFKYASKSGDSYGIPDRIYFDSESKILVIFECKNNKPNNGIKKAIDDLKIYKNKIINVNDMVLYFVAVIDKYYEIYDFDFNKIEKNINANNFLIKSCNNTLNNITKKIHEIHNYIRNNTKISNEDKSFFIACILIAMRDNTFLTIIKNYNKRDNIYNLIKENLIQFNIDFTVFEFLKNDKNNIHLLSLINIILDIYNINTSTDLLNIFYSEFVKYNNSDSKSLGIVLTPNHTIKLMIHLLNIQKDDIFLDLCCGTGSFSLEALTYNPKQIINCEYQNKLFTLMKCNMILRDVNFVDNKLIKGDCFDHTFKATKSAINPPYGMSDKKEIDFIIKQLDSVCSGGLICAIIPKSKFNSNNNNNILKSKILKLGEIKLIINCNKKLFYPHANVESCIILIKKYSNDNSLSQNKYKVIAYENDGYEIKKGTGLSKTTKYDIEYNILLKNIKSTTENDKIFFNDMSVNIDWCYKKNITTNHSNVCLTNLLLKNLEEKYKKEKEKILNNQNIYNIGEYKLYNIDYLFYVLKKPRNKYTGTEENVNLLGALNNNNGVKQIIKSNENTFTGNKILLITGGNGGAGLAFYQETSFNISSSTAILEPKNTLIMDKIIGLYIANTLSEYKNKYSYSYQWNMSRIRNDTIALPVINNKINYKKIKEIMNLIV